MKDELLEMEDGKIYFISYGGTTLIARYKSDDVCDHLIYDYLHYWAGYENFYFNACRICKSGIQEIRRASDAEKHLLVRHEIEKGCI